MRAYRLLQLVQQTSRGFEAGAALRGTVAAAWGSSAGGGASGGSAAHRAPRSLVAVPRALYHKRNPFDFRVVREDGEELPGVKNLELSIDEMDEQRKKVERGVEDAKAAALKLLGARAHSRKELKVKLLEKGHELHDVRDALDRLQSVGLQSDEEFAETFARSKWRQSKWGARRIELELHHRGVSQELAAAALRSVFGEGLDMRQHLEQMHDEDAHGQHSSSLFAGPEQMLLEGVRRQWERMARLTEEARRRRFVAWMQRRGHRWDDIRGLLHQLEKEDAQRAIDGEL